MSSILDQNEINTLIEGLESGEVKPSTESSEDEVRAFDLTAQESITRGRMPGLELLAERFAREFRTALSNHLSRSCMIQPAKVESKKFGLVAKALSVPSSLHLFRMEPFRGQALAVISPQLASSWIDALFGGSGGSQKREGREFSAIEARLLTKVVALALESFEQAWSSIHQVECVYIQHEQNPLGLSIAQPTDEVACLHFEIESDDSTHPFSIVLPKAMLEPVLKKLESGFQGAAPSIDSRATEKMKKSLQKTPVELRVELASGSVTLEKALEFKVGDVIALDTPSEEDATIYIGGKPKLRAKVGSQRGSHAVTITKVIKD